MYNQRLRHVVVVQLTTNLSDRDDRACLLVEAESPEGRAAGLSRDSVLSGYLLSLMTEDRLTDRIDRLPDDTMRKVKHCLQAALDLG